MYSQSVKLLVQGDREGRLAIHERMRNMKKTYKRTNAGKRRGNEVRVYDVDSIRTSAGEVLDIRVVCNGGSKTLSKRSPQQSRSSITTKY